MALNKVMLIGNVGNDPEIRYLDSNPQGPQGNAKVASFRLATTERYRDRNGETHENTEWHSIVAWRSSADYVEKYVHKGSQIFVEGKLRTRQWTDQTGAKRFTTEVQADNMQLLGKRPDAPQGQSFAGQPGYSAPAAPSQGGYAGPGYGAPSQPQGGYAPQPAQPQYQPASPSYPAPAPQPADSPDDDLPF
jgi:single-strand DNA-binding protein